MRICGRIMANGTEIQRDSQCIKYLICQTIWWVNELASAKAISRTPNPAHSSLQRYCFRIFAIIYILKLLLTPKHKPIQTVYHKSIILALLRSHHKSNRIYSAYCAALFGFFSTRFFFLLQFNFCFLTLRLIDRDSWPHFRLRLNSTEVEIPSLNDNGPFFVNRFSCSMAEQPQQHQPTNWN